MTVVLGWSLQIIRIARTARPKIERNACGFPWKPPILLSVRTSAS